MALTVAGAAAQAAVVDITGNDDAPDSATNTVDSTQTLTSDPDPDGGIENTVTLTGNYGGDTYRVKAFENVDVTTADPDLDITKTNTIKTALGVVKTGTADVGDVITYSYLVENVGNVTMTGLELTDVHNGSGAFLSSSIVCGAASITELGVGNNQGDTTVHASDTNKLVSLGAKDTITCTADYTVTQSDIDTLQNP